MSRNHYCVQFRAHLVNGSVMGCKISFSRKNISQLQEEILSANLSKTSFEELSLLLDSFIVEVAKQKSLF